MLPAVASTVTEPRSGNLPSKDQANTSVRSLGRYDSALPTAAVEYISQRQLYSLERQCGKVEHRADGIILAPFSLAESVILVARKQHR